MRTIRIATALWVFGPAMQPGDPGTRAPAGDSFSIDSSTATVSFQVRYLRVPQVRGSFARVTGTIEFDARSSRLHDLTLSIPSRNVATPNHKQDDLLKGPAFLDSNRYPYIRFVSDTIVLLRNGYLARGTLTLRGIEHDFSVPLELDLSGREAGQSIRLVADFRLRRPELARIMARTAPGMNPLPGTDLTIHMDLPARRDPGS